MQSKPWALRHSNREGGSNNLKALLSLCWGVVSGADSTSLQQLQVASRAQGAALQAWHAECKAGRPQEKFELIVFSGSLGQTVI